MKQASMMKDVKYVFDLLEKRFNILVIPDRSYSQHTLRLIMRAYNILHNISLTMRETAATMRTITLSLPLLLYLSPMRHRLVSQLFFKDMRI
jgi:hypothetical protein